MWLRMSENNSPTRRAFVGGAGLTAASWSRVLGANDRIGIGYIGLGNRGDQVHDAFLEHGDCETRAVCDLREDYLDFAVKKSRATPRKYADYRRLLEDKTVDAVVIATPDHWHAIMFVDACRAGKDVYVEKPLSKTVAEGRRMVQVAGETGRVVQVGIMRRSPKFLQEAAEFVRSGGIGHVTVARGFHIQNEWPTGLGMWPDQKIPEHMWDQWVGPSPMVPYDRNRTFYNFRWFYDYSGGQVTNFGVHYLDMLRWCLGKESPRSVTAMGGQYAGIRDNREIPDTLEVLWDYDGTLMVFCQYNANGALSSPNNAEMELRGTKGTMYIYLNRWEVLPEKITQTPFGGRTPLDRGIEKSYAATKKPAMEPRSGAGSIDTAIHARNFLDCVKSRGKCNCDILTGHISTSSTIIGNIALKYRAVLDWDGAAERFTNHAEANRDLEYHYRAPYTLG